MLDGIQLRTVGDELVDGTCLLYTSSYRIARLTEHLKRNRKDYSTERALTMLVGKRRAWLTDLKDRDITRYRAIVKELGLRK